MADDAPLGQEMAAPLGPGSLAFACDDGGAITPLQTDGASLSQTQQKEDEMVTALVALIVQRTAHAYLAAGGDDAADHAA